MKHYHRVYAGISLENIRHNLNSIRKRVGSSVMIMPVIKADGYGHGAVKIAKTVEDESDYFAVAVIEEAVELRDAGIKKPIMILGTLSSWCYDEAVENDIIVSVYTEDAAKKLSETAKKYGKIAKVHLKVNTGMNRIGMSCDKSGIEIAKKIACFENLVIDGIFSHFATADEADKTYAKIQLAKFEEFCNELKNNGINMNVCHICNSAGIIDMNCFYSMVRPGIILYGLKPSDEVCTDRISLKPAMELKTHVSCVKKVSQGEGISYGRTFVTPLQMKIATIPVGYADGYPRKLSNCGRVIIKGKYAPIVGRVCMDQFMVDVSHIDNVCPEDDVILIGSDGDCTVTVDEIAKLTGTINYEIVCGISKRVPRIYE